MILRPLRTALLLACLLALAGPHALAYSLLTHEQLIDLTWQDSIVPLLLSRYPSLKPSELEQARAFAYGGCVIQDIGYYPFGDPRFSNLTHYVRSGDFVVNLFRNVTNANELAFAIGALSHYVGDSLGHSTAINLAVPVEFPHLGATYGPVVSYAQGKSEHIRTEFAFDIDEVAHHRMAPIRLLRHIGLKVPVRMLALAYYQTYGLTQDFSVVKGHRFNVPGYRFSVRTFIPRLAYAITLLHRNHEPPKSDSPEAAEIENEVDAVAADNNWAFYRRRAGIGTYTLAGLIFVIPKVGPLKLLSVKGPTAGTENEYMHSLNLSVAVLRRMLSRFTPPASRTPAAHAAAPKVYSRRLLARVLADPTTNHDVLLESSDPRHPLPNRDLDTGFVVHPGFYPLTDSTYADLLRRLARRPAQAIPPGIKEDILAYYADPSAPITTKRNAKRWAQVQKDLATLAAMPTSRAPEPYPTYAEDLEEDE